jgi:hypothetical protein
MALPPMLPSGPMSSIDRFLEAHGVSSPPQLTAQESDHIGDARDAVVHGGMGRASSSPNLRSGVTPPQVLNRMRAQRQSVGSIPSQSLLPRLPSPDISQGNWRADEALPANAVPSAIIAAGAGGSSSSSCSGQGNIRVAVRVRPLPAGDQGIIEVIGRGTIAIRKEAATGGNEYLSSQRGRTEERSFDRVFGPNSAQEEVYQWCCQPLIMAAVENGRSATIFVYGATGAGKTYTMFGEQEEHRQGLICRAVNDVFNAIAKRGDTGPALEVKTSFLELYNEKLYDLLHDGSGTSGGLCSILEDERRGVLRISNLSEVPVGTASEAFQSQSI